MLSLTDKAFQSSDVLLSKLLGASLITGLVYNKPGDPLSFLENAIAKVRENPEQGYSWDMFNDNKLNVRKEPERAKKIKTRAKKDEKSPARTKRKESIQSTATTRSASYDVHKRGKRLPSLSKAADVAKIPDVPIILFMGGPGGGKTKYAAKVRNALEDEGLVHICMPDMIRAAIAKYKDRYPEWEKAHERFQRGELISNNLALDLVKAEMGRNPDAKAFFLEGFPREARQVEDFEREVRPLDLVMILDYDEPTLRQHMESRGVDPETIDNKIKDFKLKTLPSAKYFDEQMLLHLIPGEAEDEVICNRMKKLIRRAMKMGIPLSRSALSSRRHSPTKSVASPTTLEAEIVARELGMAPIRSARMKSGPRSSRASTTASRLSVSHSENNQNLDSEGGAVQSPPITNGDLPSLHKKGSKKVASQLSARSKAVASTSAAVFTANEDADSKPEAIVAQSEPKQAEVRSESETLRESESQHSHKLEPKPESSTGSNHEPKSESPPETNLQSENKAEPENETKLKESLDNKFDGKIEPNSSPTQDASDSPKLDSRPGTSKSTKSVSSVKSNNSAKSVKSYASTTSNKSLQNSKKADKVENDERVATANDIEELEEEQTLPENAVGSASASVVVREERELVSETVDKKDGDLLQKRIVGENERNAGFEEIESVIFVIGPPGSNKAEIAQRISKKFEGFDVFSMGALLRQKVQQNQNDELWRKVGETMNHGDPIPDELCKEVLFSKMQENAGSWGYVIEGYPRNEVQAKDFEDQFKRLDLALLIDCTEEFCKNAIKTRLDNATPANKRPDDAVNVVSTRLAHFKQKALPMVKVFESKEKLRVIDGDADVDKIFYEVSSIIEGTLFSEDSGIRSHDEKRAHPSKHTEVHERVATASSKNIKKPLPPENKSVKSVVEKSQPSTANENVTPATTKSQVEATVANPNVRRLEDIGYHLSSRSGPFPRGLPNPSACFLVVGPPGSTKNEISRRITKKYEGYKWYSMGGLLRSRIDANAGDELWEKVRQFMDEGKLIIDEICREVLYSSVYSTTETCNGYIFEGYPRTTEQAVDFEKQFERVDMVLLIDCTEDYCSKSLSKRWDEFAGKNGRKDDAPEITAVRLSSFKNNTLPMVRYFDEKGKVRVVDGDADVDKIFYEISSIIDAVVGPS